ncbi:hypothetical protein [Aurantiacibacter sp. MUD61]|uniref:hypothetical protein n=1 Tax=Aurantiacibacter sp. MUD61 TaxID=3009083 RepID=UPI0022EFE463|nr:hypothetical protein [Aurantiacibacter sp. MUD61]
MEQSWEDLHLRDLFYAFRKAKADRFYETSIRVAEEFISYESELADNLQDLLFRLQRGEINEVISSTEPKVVVLPKRANFAPREDGLHVHWSDFERESQNWQKGASTPEFRLVGDFSVQHHILSALWINRVGHKFDAALNSGAIASRLRRYRPKGGDDFGEYHLDAIGSFEPYYGPYRDWRDGGLAALETALRGGNDVAAITLDVSNFYHSIDPSYVLHPDFLSDARISLNEWEIDFTKAIILLIAQWNTKCVGLMSQIGCATDDEVIGLPIGLSASRLLANVFLFSLDRDLERNLSPVYYSRYVDDIFLVINDKSGFKDQNDLINFFADKVPSVEIIPDNRSLQYATPTWGGKSKILFGSEKQKIFLLSGAAGLDLLSNISEQIKSVSSERRLMPSVHDLDKLSSAKVLASANSAADDVDALRKADGLTLRRLGWAILLRSLSVLARDLDPDDWSEARRNVYRFANDHVIRADKILEYLDKIPWLFTIAVSVRDYPAARDILYRTREALRKIRSASGSRIRVNGCIGNSGSELIWIETENAITRFFREALIRSYDFSFRDLEKKSLSSILQDLNLNADELEEASINALNTDWGRVPYRCAQEDLVRRASTPDEDILHSLYPRFTDLKEFLENRKKPTNIRHLTEVSPNGEAVHEESLLPYLFPTRPYSADEVALLTPEQCVFDSPIVASRNWSRYVRALRGVWTKPNELDDLPIYPADEGGRPEGDGSDHAEPPRETRVSLGGNPYDRPIRLGISSFATTMNTWNQGASGRNDHSPGRYDAIRGIVNQAITAKPRPDYLILPELALPERWISTVSALLRQSGISLIAGLDYSYPSRDVIYSSAVLALRDDRLGYPSTIQIRQPKCIPAPGEDQELRNTFGQRWASFSNTSKPIYEHFGFNFNVLVCSELSNVAYRQSAQGKVDAMFVLSWNKDLETFSALTESTALDVHCFVALCNNRKYGDSRVRAPMKNSWERDICRLRGGLNDHLAVVEIDPLSLRRHQSRATNWPRSSDKYKPVPEGFRISSQRRVRPA